MEKIRNLCIRTIVILSSILFVILAIASFLKTAYIEDAYQIPIVLTWDNPVLNFLFLIVFFLLLYFVGKFVLKFQRGAVILLFLTCIWVFFASLLWTYLSKSGPASDSGSVYYAAKQFAVNDFSALSFRDSYFSCYPFQLGLTFFYEIIFRLVRNNNFHILQGVNAICLVIIVVSEYFLTWRFSKSKKAQIYGLLLTAGCLPLIMYGSYIYGEIPSFAFLLFATLMILMFLEDHNWFCGILTLPALSLAMLVRQNTLIFVIALGLILLLYFIRSCHSKKELPALIYLLFVILFSLQVLPMVQKNYSMRSSTQINAGVPAATYLAMGLMESPACPGGYNGYNFETFTLTADYDSAAASEIGLQAYGEKINYFSTHPLYAITFLSTKFFDQWLNSGWAIFDSTYVSFGERYPIIESCFSGPLYKILIQYMANIQMVFYLLTALFCIHLLPQRAEKINVFSILFLLTAIGGALFYLAWEASGRYVLPYAIFIIPNAAIGFDIFSKGLTTFIQTKRKTL